MANLQNIAANIRKGINLSENFEEHHLEKIIKIYEKINKEEGSKILSVNFERADEDSLSERIREFIDPQEYAGHIFQYNIINHFNKCSIEIFIPQREIDKLTVYFNSDLHKGFPILGSDEVLIKDFTEEYIQDILDYMLNGYKRSKAPSLKILKDRGDIKKELKILRIIAAAISIFLMIKFSSFIGGLILFVLIILFLEFLYPKLDIRK